MRRRDFLKLAGLSAGAAALPLGCVSPQRARQGDPAAPPNILFILADDLGYADLGCYGQTKIRTPNLDRLAREGTRFTQYYSGHPVCAPSRCSLLSGLHTGHTFIRDNREVKEGIFLQGQQAVPEGTCVLPRLLKSRGYATACIGKWGLGGVGTSGDPLAQGFDHFFGYNCQRHAHNYYPSFLIRNREKVPLEGNDGTSATGRQYAPDLMAEEALAFIQQNRDRPFFLYFSTTVPHMALQVPEDSLAEYRGRFDDKPYDGKKGYQPHPAPRAAYAAMITRLDRDIGRMMQRLKELGLEDRTLVCFASDNGPTFNGGTDSAFFQSAGPLHGLKAQVYEGGIRVPMIVRWPGRIPAGRVTDQVSAAWDVLPTVADILGAETPVKIDGVSLLPTLQGKPGQRQHEYLYWESSGLQGGEQGLRWGDWKGVRTQIHKNPNAPLTLFNLKDDLGETRDLAREQPDVAAKVLRLMKAAHEPSPEFPFKELDS